MTKIQHPGEILVKEFLQKFNISRKRLGRGTGMATGDINAVINGKSSITANMAIRLSSFLGTSPGFWLTLQKRFDLKNVAEKLGDSRYH